MEFSKAIISKELKEDVLYDELDRIVKVLGHQGIKELTLKFGYAWQGEYEWKELPVKPDEVRQLVAKAEAEEKGAFGSDDVHLMLTDLEIHFCHHGDIHLLFNKKNKIVEMIVVGWIDRDFVTETELERSH